MITPAFYRAEAERCRRPSQNTSEPATARRLALAEDYGRLAMEPEQSPKSPSKRAETE